VRSGITDPGEDVGRRDWLTDPREGRGLRAIAAPAIEEDWLDSIADTVPTAEVAESPRPL
jgi:hypothetical protein